MTDTKGIYKKLFNVQQAIEPLTKDKAGVHGSKYFDINKIIETLKPLLKKEGLVITQPLGSIEGKPSLITNVSDSTTGETISSEVILPENNDPQKMGGVITYFRRYSIQSLFFLEAEDDDAESSSGANASPAKQYVDDGKPWLTDVQFEAMKKAIEGGKSDDVIARMNDYKMKKIWREELNNLLK